MFELCVSPTTVPPSLPPKEEEYAGTSWNNETSLSHDQARCGHCQTVVPVRTVAMHEAFCYRNNAICLRCRGLGLEPYVMKKEEMKLHWHCEECSKVCA
jgi:hypothetical protein